MMSQLLVNKNTKWLTGEFPTYNQVANFFVTYLTGEIPFY